MEIFLIFAGFLLFIAALLVLHVLIRRLRPGVSSASRQKIRAQWNRIRAEKDSRHAILDADKLLDFALWELGYLGNLGAKLKKAKSLFSDLDGVWRAHKTRNNIAHQLDFNVSPKLYKECMQEFERGLKDLKVL